MTAGFLDCFLRRAACLPDAVAFVLYDKSEPAELTNAALQEGATRWAAALRARGARAGDVVLLSLPLGRPLLEAFVGVLVAGCVPSMMPVPTPKQDPRLFWSSHDKLFARLGGGLIVTTAANATAIGAHITSTSMAVLTPEAVASEPGSSNCDEPVHLWHGRDIACLQHSSGTTGLKKGVALTFDAIEAQLAALTRVLDVDGDDTIVSWLPLYHDMGFVACLLQPLRTGMTSVLLDPFRWLLDPLSFFEAIARHGGTLAWMPNFAFAHLVNAAFDDNRRVDLSSLRALIDCSETCRPETLRAFADRFLGWGLQPSAPQTCYAMAETVFAITQSAGAPRTIEVERAALEAGQVVPSSAGAALVSAGVPLPGVTLAILDEAGAPLPPGHVGQISVRAPFLFRGYHLEPERTVAAFRDGGYLTGDLGFRLEDDLFVLGRRDDLLILLGRNVYANEIEELLSDVAGLKPGRVLAMGLDDEGVGSQELVIVAETVPGTDPKATRAAIRLRLESILGITPKRVVFVAAGWLVKSTSGKIGRAENRRKFLALQDADARRSA